MPRRERCAVAAVATTTTTTTTNSTRPTRVLVADVLPTPHAPPDPAFWRFCPRRVMLCHRVAPFRRRQLVPAPSPRPLGRRRRRRRLLRPSLPRRAFPTVVVVAASPL